PSEAVSFVTDQRLSGLALVHPAWAGYLQWQTADRVRAVAGGRPLGASREASEAALWAFGGAGGSASDGEFLRKIDEWGVSFALVPQEWAKAGNFRKGWKPVYWDDMSAVIVPDVPKSADIIARYDASATYPPFFSGNLQGEKLRQVVRRLEERIRRGGDSAYAFYELGVCCFLLKDYARAEKSLELAIMTKADFAAAYHLLADIHRLRGDDQKAIDLYGLAVKFKPDLAMAYLQMGNLFFKQGDWQRGVANLKAAQAADDAWPQLDRAAPGLRKQLDDKIKEATTPRQRAKTKPDAHQPAGPQEPGKAAPGPDAPAAAADGGV
ncbi:MAG: tetratricopeptide repeat protein, partial [Planctomycetes bacterium]|nr:tetratricopeptide repeat protein [Planctomycetota bacterium]